MEVKEVKELMEQFDKSSLTTLELVFHDTTIKMNKGEMAYPPHPPQPPHPPHPGHVVVTPPPPPMKLNLTGSTSLTAMVSGVCFLSPGLKPGDSVVHEQELGYVELRGVMHPVKAPFTGRVEEIFVTNGATVTMGEPLLQLAT